MLAALHIRNAGHVVTLIHAGVYGRNQLMATGPFPGRKGFPFFQLGSIEQAEFEAGRVNPEDSDG